MPPSPSTVAKPLEEGLVPLILRAVVLEILPGEPRQTSAAFLERERQIQVMLDRAQARGERVPTLDELLELVVAPLYFYALFTEPMPVADASRLVDRLLDLVEQRAAVWLVRRPGCMRGGCRTTSERL